MSVERDFGRFEGEVLARLTSIETYLKQVSELDKRVQELEKHHAQIRLVSTMFGSVAAVGVSVLMKYLLH